MGDGTCAKPAHEEEQLREEGGADEKLAAYDASGPVGHNGDEEPRTSERLGNGEGDEPGTLAPSPARPGSDDEGEGAEGAAVASQAALNLVEIVRQEKKSVVVVEVPPSEQRTNSQDAQAERAMLGRADAPCLLVLHDFLRRLLPLCTRL